MSPNNIQVSCAKENLKELRAFLNERLATSEVSDQDASLIVLAVDEICSNIIIHANHCDASKTLQMQTEIGSGEVVIKILDEGELFDYQEYNEPELEALVNEKKKGSLGLMLVRRIMDKVEFKKNGKENICTLIKAI